MNSDDREILKAVQKNADMAIKVIGVVAQKARSTALSRELAKDKLMYEYVYGLQYRKTCGTDDTK